MSELKDEVLKIKITEIIGNVAYVNIRLRGEKSWIYIDRLSVHKGRDVVIVDNQEKTSKYVTRQVERQTTDEVL